MNKKLTLLVSGLLLTGCAVQRINDTQDSAKLKAEQAQKLIQQISTGNPVVDFSHKQYVNLEPIATPKYELPVAIARCLITLKTKEPQDIYQFSQDVTDQCRVRVRVSPDAADFLSTGGGGSGGSPTQRLSSVPAPVMPSAPGAMRPLDSFGTGGTTPQYSSAGTNGSRKISGINYSAYLPPLLDIAAARWGISWKYENSSITFFYLETKRFDIEPADAKYSLTGNYTSGVSTTTGDSGGAGGGGGGSGGGGDSSGVSGQGGSATKSDVSMGNNLYKDLKATAESMLTPGVGRLSLNQTTGTVMVTDVPDVVANIGEYLKNENKSLSKQVTFKVVIYTINNEVNDNIGIDWNLIYKSLSGDYGINLANSYNAGADAIKGGGSILDTATGRAAQFAGSSFLLKALSQQVNVANVTTANLMTTNMAAVSLMAGQQTTYLKNVSNTPFSNGSQVVTTQSLTPGSVTTGTNITIYPKILKEDRLMLNMFMDISSLKQLRVIPSKDESIEGPDLNTSAIPQRVWVNSGQTLVLNSLDQTVDDVNKQGVGSANNIFFGGGMKGSKKKQTTVITITPFIN